jgi:YD repeat-containing protein
LNRFSAATTKLKFTADADGLIASMTDENNALTAMQYKAGGELAGASFPDRTQAKYEYQLSGLRAKMVYKDGRRVEYNYDPAGNLTATKVFNSKGKQVNGQTLGMNDSYQLVRWVLFDGTETTFQYDANGNLTEIKKGKSTTSFEYDALDRLTAVVTPEGQRLTYTYKPGERSLIEQYETCRRSGGRSA